MTDTLRQDETAERLATEEIAWLTTVTGKGQPQSSPIWFLWDGESFWLRSQEHTAKVRNIGGSRGSRYTCPTTATAGTS